MSPLVLLDLNTREAIDVGSVLAARELARQLNITEAEVYSGAEVIDVIRVEGVADAATVTAENP